MAMVIQKYLGNQYACMEDYNADAGEVAEPYRLVVAVNFPVNFTEDAARRLVSIAANGPRCGVYALVAVDTERPFRTASACATRSTPGLRESSR